VSRLIVNADDFGLTAGVNRAILELHGAGALSSATLMANAAATDEAIEMARATPTLGVGCHIVLVDGEPVLSPREDVPWLADPVDGAFKPTLSGFLSHLYLSRVPRKKLEREIEAEAYAQIARLQDRGLRLTHIDTHKHTHMFPAVLRPLLRAAQKAGIRRIRNPFEPEWAVRASPRASWLRSAEIFALRSFGPAFHRVIREHGFTTTDGTVAIAATGSLDAAGLRSLFEKLPAGTWELVTHPGYNDADLDRVRTRLRASREIERQALLGVARFAGIERISFADLRLDPPSEAQTAGK
jgi:chitin disaccharide deacetylase